MKNIILIGMSGVGKTTLGKYLATKIKLDFIDTDELIESEANTTIENIFSLYGEGYFRLLESEVVEKLTKKESLIISTGGGIVLDSKNIINLRKNGILILLYSSIENIIKNLKTSTTNRPLLNGEEDIYTKVKSLYDARRELYLSSADFIVSVDNKSLDEIVYEIMEIYVKINY